MKNGITKFALIIPMVFAMGGCTEPTENISFTGSWINTNQDAISDMEIKNTVNVFVSGNLFKIVSQNNDSETIDLYDGTFLKHKSTTSQQPDSTFRSEKKSDLAVENMRFWKGAYVGNGIPGGLIAGRETQLYQAQDAMSDGEATVQAWVDAQTKVVLKKTFTIYSSQMGQVIKKTTEECQEIHYGPIDESALTKP